MSELTLRRALVHRTRELTAWQIGAVGLLVLASLYSAVATAALMDTRVRLADQEVRLQQAEHIRDTALQSLIRQAEQQVPEEEAAVCEVVEDYTYLGECVITSYCPCEICCGVWADGLTATGIPAEPGIVAVDPAVIPLGSTVVINEQEYLAADVGVKGLAIDICAAGHQEAKAYGVQKQEVWVVTP